MSFRSRLLLSCRLYSRDVCANEARGKIKDCLCLWSRPGLLYFPSPPPPLSLSFSLSALLLWSKITLARAYTESIDCFCQYDTFFAYCYGAMQNTHEKRYIRQRRGGWNNKRIIKCASSSSMTRECAKIFVDTVERARMILCSRALGFNLFLRLALCFLLSR